MQACQSSEALQRTKACTRTYHIHAAGRRYGRRHLQPYLMPRTVLALTRYLQGNVNALYGASSRAGRTAGAEFQAMRSTRFQRCGVM